VRPAAGSARPSTIPGLPGVTPLDGPVLVLATLASVALAGAFSVAVLNALTFPRLRPPVPGEQPIGEPGTAPAVSVLIPARDEASAIGAIIADLRGQSVRDLEIVVLDDDSADGTAAVARAAGEGDARLRVLGGEALPAGWAGKPWACAQLARHARAPLLLFADADTRWHPEALAAMLAERRRTGADLLSAWPTQETVTWPERLTVPLIAFTVHAYLPALAVHHLPYPSMSAAVGQCLLFRREAYEAIGGHAIARSAVLEDIALARAIKRTGGQLREADAAGLVRCRMYTDWAGVRDGFAKNMLAGWGGRASGLLAGTLFHWLILLLPWFWLLTGPFLAVLGAEQAGPGGWWPAWPLVLVGLGVATRAITAAVTRQRAMDAILLPVSALLFTLIAWRSLAWARSGGPRWKGRVIAASDVSTGRDGRAAD
jgi:chlorobactene glucosyltransferase